MKINTIILFLFCLIPAFVLSQDKSFEAYNKEQEEKMEEFVKKEDSLFTAFIASRGVIEFKKKPTKPKPKTIRKKVIPKVVIIDSVVTPNEKQIIEKDLSKRSIPPAKGKLIQVEGLVLKELTELSIVLNIQITGGNREENIIKIKDHIYSHWHYLSDPKTNGDTWRSAEATLALKYKGKYPGDCDDFAILLASLARQVGLTSRVISGFTNNAGHAWAEFLVTRKVSKKSVLNLSDYRVDEKGIWVSLDWFSGAKHKKYTNNIREYKE
ncbi:transglutaminase family protein [Polaribacter sp. R77954]|uniref:transglutaminase family protein n=1 Tax=Polaribacter sp. R77954 TaxID=3093870 RepID=UPI0037CA90E9